MLETNKIGICFENLRNAVAIFSPLLAFKRTSITTISGLE